MATRGLQNLIASGALATALRMLSLGKDPEAIITELRHLHPGSSAGDRRTVVEIALEGRDTGEALKRADPRAMLLPDHAPPVPGDPAGEFAIEVVITWPDAVGGRRKRRLVVIQAPVPVQIGVIFASILEAIDEIRKNYEVHATDEEFEWYIPFVGRGP